MLEKTAGLFGSASTGIPCVVTKVTHIGDFIRQYNCGEVIDQPDHEALFETLKKVYTSIRQNRRSAMSENAQRMIREIFNWKTILQQFHRLYKRASLSITFILSKIFFSCIRNIKMPI
jgi:glycosyltransferase involved in cell wall biosynthesis